MTFIKRSPHLPPTPRLNYVLISPFGFNWLPMYHIPIISLIHQAFRERVVPAEERTKPATVIAFTWTILVYEADRNSMEKIDIPY